MSPGFPFPDSSPRRKSHSLCGRLDRRHVLDLTNATDDEIASKISGLDTDTAHLIIHAGCGKDFSACLSSEDTKESKAARQIRGRETQGLKIHTLHVHYPTQNPSVAVPRAFSGCHFAKIEPTQLLQSSGGEVENPEYFMFRHDMDEDRLGDRNRKYTVGTTLKGDEGQAGAQQICAEMTCTGRRDMPDDVTVCEIVSPSAFELDLFPLYARLHGSGRMIPQTFRTLNDSKVLSEAPAKVKALLPKIEWNQ